MIQIEYPNIWYRLDDPSLGLMNGISEAIKRQELTNPGVIEDLRRGPLLLLVSDYSGEHRKAQYFVISILALDLSRCHSWELERQRIRRKLLPDGRRISFKTLNDKAQRKALIPFLTSANDICGNLFVFAIDKRIGYLTRKNEEFSQVLHFWDKELGIEFKWKENTYNKLRLIINFICLLVAGLSKPMQDVFWFTDEDAIAPNSNAIVGLTRLFANNVSHYLKHTVNHIKVGTARSDPGNRELEDLISVADLAAGSISDLLSHLTQQDGMPIPNLIKPIASGLKNKTRTIIHWISDEEFHSLGRFIYLIKRNNNAGKVTIQKLKLHTLSRLNAS